MHSAEARDNSVRSGDFALGLVAKIGSCNRLFALQETTYPMQNKIWTCPQCNKQMPPKGAGGHIRKHNRSFDSLKKDWTRRIWLIEERGWKCERCGISEWMSDKVPLEMDHIDGNPGNNVRENLRMLCPNCHSQMPTHAWKNVGKHKGTKRQETMSKYPSYRTRA